MGEVERVKLDDEACLADYFGYEDKCVMVKMKKSRWINDRSMAATSYLVSDSFMQVTSEVMVRGLRVEPCVNFNYKVATGGQLSIDGIDSQRNCHSCRIL